MPCESSAIHHAAYFLTFFHLYFTCIARFFTRKQRQIRRFSLQKRLAKRQAKNPGKARHEATFPGFLFGATDLIRTGDLLITSELLYQLSHSSRFYIFCNRQYSIIFPAFCQGRIFSFRPAAGAQSGSIHKPPCSTRQKPARYSPAGHASSG